MSKREELIQLLKHVVMQHADGSGIVCANFTFVEAIADALLERFCMQDHCMTGQECNNFYGHTACCHCGHAREGGK